MNVYLVKSASAFSAAFAIAIGAAMSSFAMGKIGKAALDGMSRQPEVAGRLFTSMLIACALVEALAIYCLLVAILLIAANPLVR
ncbi:MAG: ATP synthase F0 subunit C [Actinobacteria bacterium]|nr:ATP synthase F0 subunit C [Actinomycetota bacterium]